ncbi:PI-PLC X DOMAIN PLANT-LIKE PROTEIN [Salix viminalis]|uniref:PI-PLC X DOMAIN PLANT-LIKE PROTEIN n=1 Tax=Salix viminalis TaxID=40686 RepID=A0A9Q0NYT4_SALVM|nr:PI-PLC X DOMAIN PLANT-LIKE PROTEIN [Salix viminalis]
MSPCFTVHRRLCRAPLAIGFPYLYLLLSSLLIAHAQVFQSCNEVTNCGPGLYCGNCLALGKTQPICTRGQAILPNSIINGLPFNKYTWLVTHNSFSIVDAPSLPGVQRLTFYNQEDTVTNQLRNGVRGLMLDMYDFEGDIWLCHSFRGQCYNFTAFQPAINTLREVEAFLRENPTEIVTIIIEDYVHTPKGLINLFTNAGLDKYWFPVSKMPKKGEDWPTVTEMVQENNRLVVFTSIASKEAEEGIAYQWKYLLENEAGDPGLKLKLAKEHSTPLAQMVGTCYKAAGNVVPNFLAVNFYMRSDGGGVFDAVDRMNGQTCGCSTVTACQAGAPFGSCKNVTLPNQQHFYHIMDTVNDFWMKVGDPLLCLDG